ncbi:hypothetical protein [Chitinophaga silvisoli]|uniref:hypothetical protein n=1 Tax=Chitinophaga silvisoli TaxID=2291814 RepID=UPI0011C0E14B|nr:hypothetical protein [Chitinophaga silvisoli]
MPDLLRETPSLGIGPIPCASGIGGGPGACCHYIYPVSREGNTHIIVNASTILLKYNTYFRLKYMTGIRQESLDS